MSESSITTNSEPEIDWAIFTPAVIVILAGSLYLMVNPESAGAMLSQARKFIMNKFLWGYLTVGFSALVFCMLLAFGPCGRVKLAALAMARCLNGVGQH